MSGRTIETPIGYFHRLPVAVPWCFRLGGGTSAARNEFLLERATMRAFGSVGKDKKCSTGAQNPDGCRKFGDIQ
jgi:hypothetical protein